VSDGAANNLTAAWKAETLDDDKKANGRAMSGKNKIVQFHLRGDAAIRSRETFACWIKEE
jgi:hypothetical protein